MHLCWTWSLKGLPNYQFVLLSPTVYSQLTPFADIFVPPEQVIDTVDLYFVKARQRRLSLRFLAWYILKKNIQTDTHDSIEDARSALDLYHAYQDLEEQGVFDAKLDEIYKEGRQYVRLALSLERPRLMPHCRTSSHQPSK
jgi:DNA polymerase III epsilon subunit-like protein